MSTIRSSKLCSFSPLKRGDEEPPQHHSKKPRLQISKVEGPATSKTWLTKIVQKDLEERIRLQEEQRYHRAPPKRQRLLTRRPHTKPQSPLEPSTPASNFQRNCSDTDKKGLHQAAKRGGPDLQDLRGFNRPMIPQSFIMNFQLPHRPAKGKAPTAVPSSTEPTQTSSAIPITDQSKTTNGSYDPNFRQRMLDAKCYPEDYVFRDGRSFPEAHNTDDIQRMLVERRASLSSSVFQEEKFQSFKSANRMSQSESDVRQWVLPIIQGSQRNSAGDIPFRHMANLLPGPSYHTKPDVYYGAQTVQIDLPVREALGYYIFPSSNTDRPCVPNFFVEAKASSGDARRGFYQACYDGAIGARAMHKVQNYGVEVPVYDNNAYSMSVTYCNGHLMMYSHHIRQPGGPGTQPEYYMNEVKSWSMTSDREQFVNAVAAFRNARDWADAQRDAAIEQANRVARTDAKDVDVLMSNVDGAGPADPVVLSQHETSAHPAMVHALDGCTRELRSARKRRMSGEAEQQARKRTKKS